MKTIVKSYLLLFFGIVFLPIKAQEVHLKISKPLSAQDQAAVQALLKNFDPNTYSFNSSYISKSGKTETMKLGTAKGLADVKMTNTKIITSPSKATSLAHTNNILFKASTVTNNNIFKASTVTNNNIFKATLTTNSNIFKVNDEQASKLNQLHQILSKYQ